MKKKPVAISDESSSRTYKGLQYLARFAVWIYFRNVKVITRDPPASRQGPVLVAANHMNMVLDPAVLVATFPHGRRCHFWALARFFRIPIVGRVLYAAGVLPVNTQTRSNAKLFEHTLSCLEQGGVVALFPEGKGKKGARNGDGLIYAICRYILYSAATFTLQRWNILGCIRVFATLPYSRPDDYPCRYYVHDQEQVAKRRDCGVRFAGKNPIFSCIIVSSIGVLICISLDTVNQSI